MKIQIRINKKDLKILKQSRLILTLFKDKNNKNHKISQILAKRTNFINYQYI